MSNSSDEEAENMTVEPGATLKNGCKIYNDLFDDACKSIAKEGYAYKLFTAESMGKQTRFERLSSA